MKIDKINKKAALWRDPHIYKARLVCVYLGFLWKLVMPLYKAGSGEAQQVPRIVALNLVPADFANVSPRETAC